MSSRDGQRAGRFMLWVDAVGGYWVCLGDAVTLGQPVPGADVDVPILGDISSRHATIRRDGEGYVIEAIREVLLDGRPLGKAATLRDGSRIQLGDRVRLRFLRPHALSATARLEFESRHRTQPSADAVLLMADTCVLGPRPHCHVVCRDWPQEVILYRHDDELYCRTVGTFRVDGVSCQGRSQISRSSQIDGEDFSLSLEPIG
jgi:hypothetical protein